MTAAPWQVVAASVQGASHQKQNLPCQDAHAVHVLPDGTVLLAVADGAGSAARSREGADLAVRQAIRVLVQSLDSATPADARAWNELMRAAYARAREALLERAAQEQVAPHVFATTLTCALASAEWLVAGRLGDGAIIIELTDGALVSSVPPVKGEYANETFFLTMPQAQAHVEVQAMRAEARALMLMSDGLIRLALKLPDHTPHMPFFQPLVAFATNAQNAGDGDAQLAEFLSSERVNARTDDDKTLVIAVRAPERQPARRGVPAEVSA